ncbi:MAG: glycerophosphoryl diester phosphodiesterase membrane domain-containing protein [Sphingomonas sp.]|nr:glycerophosphoryl diester phosphodiesterase membrane domain-containing protein [Sphingomonas sp.]
MSSLSIGRAWEEAKAALVAGRRLLVPIALGLVLLPAGIMSMVEPQAATGQQPPAGPWMVVALIMIVVMIIGELAIVLLVNGWRGSVGSAISKAARRTPVFILAALCFVLPLVVVFSAVLVASGASPGESGQVDWTNFSGAGWLLMLLALLAMIYFSVRLMLLLVVAACETLGPIDSLKRSFALSSGHFWRLFAFILLLVIAFAIVAATIGAVVGSLVTLLAGEPRPWSLSLLLIALTGGLVQAAFVLVYTGMLARIYAQLAAPTASVPEVEREG